MMNHSRQSQLIGVLVVTILLLAATSASARLLEVKQDGTKEYSVLQDALSAAATGDTILIHPGNYQNWTERYHGGAIRRAVGFIESGVTIMAETWAAKIIPPDMIGGMGLYSVTAESVAISNVRILGTANNNGIFLPGGGNTRIERCLIEDAGTAITCGGPGNSTWISETRFLDTDAVWCTVGGRVWVWACEMFNAPGLSVTALIATNGATAEMFDCSVTNARAAHTNTGGHAIVRDVHSDGGRAGVHSSDPGSVIELSRVSISGSYLGGPGAIGLQAENSGSLFGSQLRVSNFQWGVALRSAEVVQVNDSHILDWTEWAAIAQFNTESPTKIWDLTGNWWGTADSTAIAEAIWDGRDDPVGSPYGFIEFWPAATQRVPVQQRSVGRMKGAYGTGR